MSGARHAFLFAKLLMKWLACLPACLLSGGTGGEMRVWDEQ